MTYRAKIKQNSNLTTFQKKVLLEALKIPRGKVVSYSDIAKRIGTPRAVRAVGSALGKNPYAPEVPCHRVIASNGSIGGYSGGIRKKVALLKKEGIAIKEHQRTRTPAHQRIL